MLPQGLIHIPLGGGKSYENPIKYIQDALRLENQIFERLRDGSNLKKEAYHLYYLSQSFNYAGMRAELEAHCKLFPYGKGNLKEFNKRGVFYWTKYMENFGEDWYALKERGYLHHFSGDDLLAIKDWLKSYELNPKRSESIFEVVRVFFNRGHYKDAVKHGKELLKIKCPYPEDTYFVEYNKYHDTGWQVGELVATSLHKHGMETQDEDSVKFADTIIKQLLKRKKLDDEVTNLLKDHRVYFKRFLEKESKDG
jgi:tetratricopeptide (TPR) repeat protein